jgi:hypothetical protein
VVVHNFDVVSVPLAPAKADAVLIVDSDAVLSGPVSFKSFQSVAWTGGKIAQGRSDVQGVQPSAGDGLDIDKTDDTLSSAKQPFGIGTSERLNHYTHYTNHFTESVNIYG